MGTKKKKSYGSWTVVGGYDEGGQSKVLLVKKTGGDEQQFVLKLLKNKKRLARFRLEVEAGISLKHSNIVEVVDYDLDGQSPFLVTKLYTGGNLNHLSRLAFCQTLEIFESICEAVSYAHSQKVVHRDIKPANIFLERDFQTPIIGDFGLCLFLDDERKKRFTFLDEQVGPRFYMAPELEDGRQDKVTNACDVYSLGKLLYWLFARRIFSREKHRDASFNLELQFQGMTFFSELNKLLDRAIEQDPESRIQSVEELRRQVAAIRQRETDRIEAEDGLQKGALEKVLAISSQVGEKHRAQLEIERKEQKGEELEYKRYVAQCEKLGSIFDNIVDQYNNRTTEQPIEIVKHSQIDRLYKVPLGASIELRFFHKAKESISSRGRHVVGGGCLGNANRYSANLVLASMDPKLDAVEWFALEVKPDGAFLSHQFVGKYGIDDNTAIPYGFRSPDDFYSQIRKMQMRHIFSFNERHDLEQLFLDILGKCFGDGKNVRSFSS